MASQREGWTPRRWVRVGVITLVLSMPSCVVLNLVEVMVPQTTGVTHPLHIALGVASCAGILLIVHGRDLRRRADTDESRARVAADTDDEPTS